MDRIRFATPLAVLAVVALALALAPAAEAQGPKPRNGVVYTCASSGSLQGIVFDVYGSPTFLRGECRFKEGGVWDWKKCDLAWQNNSSNWELTQVGEGQCQNVFVYYDGPYEWLYLLQCSGSLSSAQCWAYRY